MAVLEDVVLVADGGDITAGRQTSTLVFGEFNVLLPEDLPPAEERDGRIKDGYIYRPRADFGPFDVGFARADATIDLAAQTSDLEAVVDAAQKQADGDVFFERDITIVGLGGFVPGVDFQVGDIVTVELWGGLVDLALPVTDITMISSDSEGVIAWRVHVGGMLISDLAELKRSNEELRRQVRGDRRGVEQARSDAASARSTADRALREVRDADGVIRGLLDDAVAAEERGRGFVREALEEHEKAKTAYGNALSQLSAMEHLLAESDTILDKNDALFKNVETLHDQVRTLHGQITVASQQFRMLLGSAAAHSAQAQMHEQQAMVHVDRAEELRKQIEPLVEEAQRQVEAGKKHVKNAFAHSESARGAVSDARAAAQLAQDKVEEAQQALTDARGLKQDADAAAREAADALSDLQQEAERVGDALSTIDDKQNQVLTMHQTVLTKHGEVMDAHQKAIDAVAQGVKAAGASAGSAAMGAMYAQLTAEDAARAADSALEVGRLNTEAIALLEEVQGEHSKALRELGDAQTKLREATDDLIEAGKVQDRINTDLQAAQDTLEKSQDELKTITQNLQESQRLTNQAVRAAGAAAGFAAQTGMHAADTAERATRAADSALEAGRLNSEAILASQYSIEYNKILAEAYAPQKFYLKSACTFGGYNRISGFDLLGAPITGLSVTDTTVDRYDYPLILSLGRGSFDATVSGCLGIKRKGDDYFITAGLFSSSFSWFNNFIGIAFDDRDILSKGVVELELSGTVFPAGISPDHKKRLDALTAKYRKAGLKI